MWASLRAQTLARTVQGMMYYEAALRLLARLEKVRAWGPPCFVCSSSHLGKEPPFNSSLNASHTSHTTTTTTQP